MPLYYYYFLVLGLVSFVQCDFKLQIVKDMEGYVSPVSSENVEEKAGTAFSLICELITTDNDTKEYDENLSWAKGEKAKDLHSSNIVNRFKPVTSRKTINEAEKEFRPLRIEDKGTYFCVSLKFNLFKSIDLRVRHDIKRLEPRPLFETNFCNDQMFQCVSNGVCIISHYVCDGVADCRDRSDESEETCKGDPCRDKIPCDEGRCIPTSWCCDRNHDLNCTVTNRPKCCQILSESYEEFGFPNVNQTQINGARYLFVLVCILSILFSVVLLLLILSKVLVIYAKKAVVQEQRHRYCENIALRSQTAQLAHSDGDVYGFYRNSRTPRRLVEGGSDVGDPLLFPPRFAADPMDDQPPSYVDVLRSGGLMSEPPPPYASTEMLDVDGRGRRAPDDGSGNVTDLHIKIQENV
ncbi:unnamed protein product [Brassicogethes aeneus]|uniref:Ig-like domain-containing protein n=1 Tax=Brassicogethes aeneus TaxID=1431903 RepID=A0A9P0AXE1_BRAAE|nr:unnamed protein product [Brassicogethes aeneus]